MSLARTALTMTDVECLEIWKRVSLVGAGGPQNLADQVAIALVRLAAATDDPIDFGLWLCAGLGMGGSSGALAVIRCSNRAADIRAEIAARASLPVLPAISK